MGTSSIKEVARQAGVSIGTVSNVLNRPDLVSPATKQRVLDAITSLGYVRNDSARQLRAGSSRMIAVVVLDLANPFFTDVVRSVETHCGRSRLDGDRVQQRRRPGARTPAARSA